MEMQESKERSGSALCSAVAWEGRPASMQEGLPEDEPQGHILSSISRPNTFCLQSVQKQGGRPRQGKEVRGEGAGLQCASCWA